MEEEPIIEAVLEAYDMAKVFFRHGLPDHEDVQVLVVFKMGDLRKLERKRTKSISKFR